MNSYILCVRDKASGDDKFGSGLGSTSYLEVPDSANVPLPSHKVGGVRLWLDKIVKQANPPETASGNELDVVFFIHGYNTDPEEAIKRQRLVEKNLKDRGFQCMVIGFDWPTAGSAALYAYDRFEAQSAASLLVKGGIIPFANYTLKDCPINIHVLAHSMGGFVVREAFRAVDKGRNADLANDWRIGQLVLFAADISSDCFALNESEMVPVFDHCGRLTNYFSGYDKALGVSNIKNIDISSRVGRVGMPSDTPANDKAVDVDCGPRYTAIPEEERKNFKVIDGMVSHSWYLEDTIWYDDLAYTLKGQLDRNSIPTRTRIGLNDFVLTKGG
jgi:pimeloyl-ACP methyl ester carboxylesterase